MHFSHPWFLLLLIPIIAGLWWSWPRVKGIAKPRKVLVFMIRGLLACSLVLALSGLELTKSTRGLCTVFVLDRSDSIREEDQKAAQEFISKAMEAAGPDDRAALVVFGREPSIDLAPAARKRLDKILSVTDGSSSDIAAAIRLASATFPDGKARRLVILSDGNETAGDAADAAMATSTDGIQIDVVALGTQQSAPEVTFLGLEVPNEAIQDQPFRVRAIIQSTKATSGSLLLERDGRLVDSVRVNLREGRNSVALDQKLAGAGFYRYRAILESETDTDSRNNVGTSYVSVRGKTKILVVATKPERSVLGKALTQQGILTETFGPEGVPRNLADLQQYDAILFDDLNAMHVLEPQMRLMQSAVRDAGIGFAMIGGENSFLPGGYYGTPIAEVLPVDLDIKQRKSFPSTSILVIIDASGSMAMVEDGDQKIRLAAKAAERIVEMMNPVDRIGVAGSSDSVDYVAPLAPAANKAEVIDKIRKLQANTSGIFAYMSLEWAEREILKETSKVRHIIFLGDGMDVDNDGPYLDVVNRLRAQKVTVTAVAIGDGPDTEHLKRMASAGGGRYFLADRAGKLPAIFSQDAAIVSRAAIEEGPFLPKLFGGDDILEGISSTPALYGYCLSEKRPLARTSMKTQKDDPLLATWQYGLGRSLAFTSDAQAMWAAQWVPWEGYGRFWSQAVRAIVRRPTVNDYQINVRNEGGVARVQIEATDRAGNPLNSLAGKVFAGTPDGRSIPVPISQVGPGKYEGAFDAKQLGTYIVSVSEGTGANSGARVQTVGLSIPYPPEYQRFLPNMPLLQSLAEVGGGLALKSPAEAFRTRVDPARASRYMWQLLLMISALLLPLDVGVRRVAIPIAGLLAAFRARRARDADAVQTVAVLRTAKARAQTGARPVDLPSIAKSSDSLGSSTTSDTVSRSSTSPPKTPESRLSERLLDAKRKRGN